MLNILLIIILLEFLVENLMIDSLDYCNVFFLNWYRLWWFLFGLINMKIIFRRSLMFFFLILIYICDCMSSMSSLGYG